MKHKLMEVMRLREDARQLSGRVELDNGDLGGAYVLISPSGQNAVARLAPCW